MNVPKVFTWKIYAEVSRKASLSEIFDVNIVKISCSEILAEVGHEYCFAAFQTLILGATFSAASDVIKLH